MRIVFKPIEPTNQNTLSNIVSKYDLIDNINPIYQNHFNHYNISNIQTYTDESRYLLNIFRVNYDRIIDQGFNLPKLKTSGLIQVVYLKLQFDFDFNFELLSSHYFDYWKNDLNINLIRPHFYSNASKDLGYFIFKSLTTSFFSKMLNEIKTNNIVCFKKFDEIILAYNLENQDTINNLNDILDYFLDAIYEMVKISHAKLNFSIPEEKGLINIRMDEWYNKKRKNK